MINSSGFPRPGWKPSRTQLDVISHNLANVSTTGYKRANAVFEDLMYQNLRQVGANTTDQSQLPTGLHLGLGVRTVATSRSFSQGTLQQTEQPADVAIQGSGFFQITMPDGTTQYTRDGSFQVDSQGRLVTANGLPVANGVTCRQRQNVTIANDGTGHRVHPGQTAPQSIGTITLASFINPAGLSRRARTCSPRARPRASRTTGTPGTNGLGTLSQGFLESSNVNVVQELITMIQTQRAYEMNSKAIQTSDQMLQKLGQL